MTFNTHRMHYNKYIYITTFSKIKGRFHRPGLTLQLAKPRLRDNRGLSPARVPSLSVTLTAHLTCDLTSFR